MKSFLISLFVVFLSGCATTETIKRVQSQKYVMVEIDPRYLQDCLVEPPPNKKDYLEAGHDEREDMMTRVLLKQYQYIRHCNLDKKSIRELIDKQKKEVENFNLTEEKRLKQEGVEK